MLFVFVSDLPSSLSDPPSLSLRTPSLHHSLQRLYSVLSKTVNFAQQQGLGSEDSEELETASKLILFPGPPCHRVVETVMVSAMGK